MVTFLPPLGIYPWEGRLPLLGYYIHDKEITEGERAVCARGKEGERVTDPSRGNEKGGKVTREPKVYTSRMSFLLTVGFLKVGNQPITGNRKR